MNPEAVSGRERRLAAVGFAYAAQPLRRVEQCNLCGGRRFVVLAHRDRYGFPATANACRACGLVFLNPVMTADAYAAFYRDVYRPLVSAYHGRTIDAVTMQPEQREYARERVQFLSPFLAGLRAETLVDIGGSTGVVAHELARAFGLRATVLDPAPLELLEAQKLGLETITGLVEAYDFGDRRFDVAILCQTIDHLLDIAGTLQRVWELLPPGGLLYVDIVDFRAAYLRHRSVEAAIKIDHPYYLMEPTMEAYLQRAGFEILGIDYAADRLHVGYACRRADPVDGARPPEASVRDLLREVRAVQNGG